MPLPLGVFALDTSEFMLAGLLADLGSYATAALTTCAAAGPLIAAATLGTTAGDLGPFWTSGLLPALALLVALAVRDVVAGGRRTGPATSV